MQIRQNQAVFAYENASLIERVDLGDRYKVYIKFKISKAQFEGQQQ